MNIFFLDLDGPVFPNMTIRFDPMNRRPYPGSVKYIDKLTYWKMNDHFRYFWQHINDVHDFKVVLSSTWKTIIPEKEFFEELFEVNNVPLSFHDDWHTPNHPRRGLSDYTCYRAQEIHAWVDNHPELKGYVIMDDVGSGASLSVVKHREESNHADTYELKRLENVNLNPDAIVMVDYDSGIGSLEALRVIDIMKGWK